MRRSFLRVPRRRVLRASRRLFSLSLATAVVASLTSVGADPRAAWPHDPSPSRRTQLASWVHCACVQSTSTDETVTYTSDDTWANGMCATLLAGTNSPYV